MSTLLKNWKTSLVAIEPPLTYWTFFYNTFKAIFVKISSSYTVKGVSRFQIDMSNVDITEDLVWFHNVRLEP
jgi:hypothetical protein